MAVGDGIERSGIDGDDVLQAASERAFTLHDFILAGAAGNQEYGGSESAGSFRGFPLGGQPRVFGTQSRQESTAGALAPRLIS